MVQPLVGRTTLICLMFNSFTEGNWSAYIHSQESAYVVNFSMKVDGEILVDEYCFWHPKTLCWEASLGRQLPKGIPNQLLVDLENEMRARAV